MLWRSSTHHRLLQCRLPCYPPLYPASRNIFTATQSVPNVASALASRILDDRNKSRIEVVGAVRTIRKQKHHAFLEVGDGSSVHSLQAVLKPDQAEGLSTGTSVAVQGVWQPSPPGKEQSHELHAEEVTIVGTSEGYPIQKKFQTPEFLRTIPHLRLRLPIQALLTRMRSESDFLLAQFFRGRGFLRTQPPVITSSDCEGAGETFSVSSSVQTPSEESDGGQSTASEELFFRGPKYLTVSSQLHLEAYMSEHPKVWTFAPTFRAEKSDTPRHVSEFWMLEAEIRTQSLPEIMDLVEDMVISLVQGLKSSTFMEELHTARRLWNKSSTQGGIHELLADGNSLQSRWDCLERGSWPRITYNEAIQLLQDSVRLRESKFVFEPDWETGLQLEHERYIAAKVGQGKPVFVTHYPLAIKPFYMLPSSATTNHDTTTAKTAACFDLLLPELCEVVGGSLREHRLKHLMASMGSDRTNPAIGIEETEKALNHPLMSGSNLNWYVDLRRYGSIPHGGFGFGFDRLLCYLTGIRNIKDTVPWPRYYGRCDC